MIERMVMCKLKEEFRNEDTVRDIAAYTQDTLQNVARVSGIYTGEPADEKTAEGWDIVIVIQLPTADDISTYRRDPTHRAYYEKFLKPKLEFIKVFNFRRFDI